MNEEEVFPVVIVSKCLEFEACRYDGLIISDSFVAALKPFVHFIPVCPEVEIGLGLPRAPIRIILSGREKLLYQSATGGEFSRKMSAFADRFLNSLSGIDGFIMKSKSPSCGIRDANIFPDIETQTPVEKGAGFFGGEIFSRFGCLAVEDEGRLKNFRIRDHFLTQLFTFARLRKLKENPTMQKLIEFQSKNKLLFMAYSQSKAKKLGAIVANHKHLDIQQLLERYQDALTEVLKNPPRTGSLINMLEHAFGGVSRDLSVEERTFFKKNIEDFREGKIPYRVPLNLIHSWALRFETKCLKDQTIINLYPLGLMNIADWVKEENPK